MTKTPAENTELAPIREIGFGRDDAAAPLHGDAPLAFYWSVVRRYLGRIAVFVLLATSAATLVALVLPKQYAATAVLRIDPASDRTVGEQNNSASNISVNALDLMTTEANVVTSPAVVQKMIEDLHLDQNPEFVPKGAGVGGAPLTPLQENQVMRLVTRAITVDQPLNSYLLSVSFRSLDANLSAGAANDLLNSLIQHDFETRLTALTSSSQSMQAQLTDLRAKMEKSQQQLVEYESANDVLNPDSSNNIMQARLSQVNRDLGDAQTQRMGLQADYDVVRQGNLDALMASSRGQYLLPLQQRLQDDQRRLAQMAQMYGPNYPVYKQQLALVQNDQSVLQEQEQHVANQVAAEYLTAQARESLLQQELALQKQRMDAFNLKAIRYYALKAAADAYTQLYYQLQQSIQNATVAASLHSESLRIISPARPVLTPVFPRPLFTAVLSFLIASMLGVGAALVIGILDHSISTAEQVEQFLDLPLLAALPAVQLRDRGQLVPVGYSPKLLGAGEDGVSPAALAASSPFREAILGLHSGLMLMQERDLDVLAITSSVPAEGKTTVSTNLAAAFAGLGMRTLLVDTDMRKPGVHRQFQLSNRRGLSTLLRGQCVLEQVLNDIPGTPNLTVLPGGPMPSSPAQLLHMGLEDLLAQLRGRFDRIILDCPPVLGFADSLAPANLADGCILVVQAGTTERQLVSGAIRQLKSARTALLGVVLNNLSQKHGAYYSYYSHYYTYQQGADAGADRHDDDD